MLRSDEWRHRSDLAVGGEGRRGSGILTLPTPRSPTIRTSIASLASALLLSSHDVAKALAHELDARVGKVTSINASFNPLA